MRQRERDSGNEIYSLPSVRCINNDIGVFTSTHAPKRVQGGLLYRGTGPAIYNSPRRESCTLNRVNGIDTYRPVRRHTLRGQGFCFLSSSLRLSHSPTLSRSVSVEFLARERREIRAGSQLHSNLSFCDKRGDTNSGSFPAWDYRGLSFI